MSPEELEELLEYTEGWEMTLEDRTEFVQTVFAFLQAEVDRYFYEHATQLAIEEKSDILVDEANQMIVRQNEQDLLGQFDQQTRH